MITPNYHKNTIFFNIRPQILINLFFIIAILSVYWQVGNFEFTRFDDGVYVYENRHIQDDLTVDNIIWALTSTLRIDPLDGIARKNLRELHDL
jgi:hypothetical protein